MKRANDFTTVIGAIMAALLCDPPLWAENATAPSSYVLEPEAVWTAGSTSAHVGWVVVVRGGHIAAVGPKASTSVPASAQVLALPGTTLIPGLILAAMFCLYVAVVAGRDKNKIGRAHV